MQIDLKNVYTKTKTEVTSTKGRCLYLALVRTHLYRSIISKCSNYTNIKVFELHKYQSVRTTQLFSTTQNSEETKSIAVLI